MAEEATRVPVERSPSRERWAEAIGWFGSAAVLGAFALLTFAVLSSNSPAYQGLNVMGALALAWLAYVKTAWPAVALNLVWAAIGVGGLVV